MGTVVRLDEVRSTRALSILEESGNREWRGRPRNSLRKTTRDRAKEQAEAAYGPEGPYWLRD